MEPVSAKGISTVKCSESFSCPVIPQLSEEVRNLLAQIPPGRVTTFGDLADALGDITAARWIARELITFSDVPWYRVVKRTGQLALPKSDQAALQRQLLMQEGVIVDEDGRIDLQAVRWNVFRCHAPLRKLAEWQLELALRADGTTDVPVPSVIAGLDVSYASDNEAVGAYVEIDVATGAILFSATHRAEIVFPYLTGYLTFRELPVHLALLEQVRAAKPLAKVILVDGAGRLHPRRSGIAVAVGVVADCVTIGVTKHHLCGRALADDREPLLELNGTITGQSLVGSSRKPLQISPGHGLSLASAVACVRAVWPHGRVPIPIREADAVSRRVAKAAAVNALRFP